MESSQSRRALLQGLTATTVATVLGARSSAATPSVQPIPISGQPVAALAGFDQVMTTLMQTWNLPGGQLAVGKHGRLVFNRGFGLANIELDEPVQPANLFRIASVTKT
ncbi:MAG: beta-lactamase family protein, partial [Chloroflexota bacterium]|nr:beta-lactamase family protein [Chloroflexota bacterium]